MSFLILGFLLGMQHALEADHIAAILALSTRGRSLAGTVRQGALWGLGHATALFVFGSIVLLLDTVVPHRLAQGLELAVGVILIGLGVDVLRRLRNRRVHFHVHIHRDGTTHMHAHCHQGETGHDVRRHEHAHPKTPSARAFIVGIMHGMAGSAALILLALHTVESVWTGLLYILLFGIGSVVGMSVLSATIAIPLHYSPRSLTWLHNGLHAAIGVVSIVIGSLLIHQVAIDVGRTI